MTQRPVLAGFHPDPTVCRVGDTYYLAVSSFEYAPGVPLFRSSDLRHWEQIANILDRPDQLQVATAGPSGGIFAPTLRHHDGRFWLITTNWADEGGQLLVWADHPEGPWSDPVRIPSVLAIDPDLAWDEDGTCYLTCAAFGRGIVQYVIDPLTGALLSEARPLWSGTGGKFPEGPHLYQVGKWWYLMIAEGGTERGHAVTIARGTAPTGPFEPHPQNPILTHRSTAEPVQNTGHADLVQRPDASWAIVYHGTRPRGASPEWHVLGRETFADEVEWFDGWPSLTTHLDPPATTEVTIEELADGPIPLSWVGAPRFPGEVMTRAADGWRVSSGDADPVFVGRRQQHLFARVSAQLDVDGTGGLTIRIDPDHSLSVMSTDGTVRVIAVVGGLAHEFPVLPPAGARSFEIRALPSPGHAYSTTRGPDLIVAGVNGDNGFLELGRLDGRYLSTEVAGGMTGRMIGVLSVDGNVLIRSWRYNGSDQPGTWLEEPPVRAAIPLTATMV